MTDSEKTSFFLRRAIELASQGSSGGFGGPFGAVVVKDGVIVGEGYNEVLSSNDPSAHAEIVAIRNACRNLSDFQLTGCEIYCSCEPCPMCLGAIYWARPDRVYFGSTRLDAANAGFDDALIYNEIPLPPQRRMIPMFFVQQDAANEIFEKWILNPGKVPY